MLEAVTQEKPDIKQIWSDIEAYNEHADMKLGVSEEWQWLECQMKDGSVCRLETSIARDIPTAQLYLGAVVKKARMILGYGARTFRTKQSGGLVTTRWVVFDTEDEAARYLHSTYAKPAFQD